MRARRIEPAHGRVHEAKPRQRLQWYELGEVGTLTPAEVAALTLLAEGFTYESAAKFLGKARFTVARQLASARKKLEANTSTHAVAIAIRDSHIIFTESSRSQLRKLDARLEAVVVDTTGLAKTLRQSDLCLEVLAKEVVEISKALHCLHNP